mmetsp:Transcript_69799/g.110952  ORF Transcript_69799/g.110952 Transcript_69799/m.110952 type:complete len:295 (-) Transcript_69799:2736-3620(-)
MQPLGMLHLISTCKPHHAKLEITATRIRVYRDRATPKQCGEPKRARSRLSTLMNAWLCILCRIGTPRALSLSRTCRTPLISRRATAVSLYNNHSVVLLILITTIYSTISTTSTVHSIISTFIFIFISVNITSSNTDIAISIDVILLIITANEAQQAFSRQERDKLLDSSHSQQAQAHLHSAHSSSAVSSVNKDMNDNTDDTQKQKQKDNDNDNENEKQSKDQSNTAHCKAAEGILSSPKNPATLRRLSQTEQNNEVSWHKRVVVHRVPRSDASRSMFQGKGKDSSHSSQCCILL